MSITNILNKIRTRYRFNNNIGIEELNTIGRNAIIIDVRSNQEYREHHINGAICIPSFEISQRIEREIPDKNALIVLYCQSGIRSRKALNILLKKGYTNVYHIRNGLDG